MRKYEQVFSVGFLVTPLSQPRAFALTCDKSCASISIRRKVFIIWPFNGDHYKLIELLKPFGSVLSGLATSLVFFSIVS